MKRLKNDWLIGAIIFLPLLLIACYWNRFPEQMPVHFNRDGEPDNYAHKAFGLFLFPILNIVFYGMFSIIPYIDPAKKNYARFMSKFRIVQITIHAFLSFMFFVLALYALGLNIPVDKVILYAVLMLFLILGNYMGNLRQNYFIGIRTPWTLADQDIWNKTHRLSARLWVFATLMMMVVVALMKHPYPVFIGYVIVIALIPMAYSYILFRKKEQMNNPE